MKLIPFFEQIFVALLFALLAPGILAEYELANGKIVTALLIFSGWILIFIPLALFLDRHGKVKLLVSLPGATLVLIAFWFGVLK